MRKFYSWVVLIICLLSIAGFSGCSKIKSGLSKRCLSKAGRILSTTDSPGELTRAFGLIEKSLEYDPDSVAALEFLDETAQAKHRKGFARALELETKILKKYLLSHPRKWDAYTMLINVASFQGNVRLLRETAKSLENVPVFSYPANLALGFAYCELLPWIASQGHISSARDAEVLLEKADEFLSVTEKLKSVASEITKAQLNDPGLKKTVSTRLLSSYEVALQDADKRSPEIARMRRVMAKIKSDPSMKKALRSTVDGNRHLAQKDYSRARACYLSALVESPGFVDARHQLVNIDFQEGAVEATDGNMQVAKQLLNKAYSGSIEVLRHLKKYENCMPFQTVNKVLAQAYSMRAAILSALHTLGESGHMEPADMEREFKASLEEAIRLNPESKLARDLLERYAKYGF